MRHSAILRCSRTDLSQYTKTPARRAVNMEVLSFIVPTTIRNRQKVERQRPLHYVNSPPLIMVVISVADIKSVVPTDLIKVFSVTSCSRVLPTDAYVIVCEHNKCHAPHRWEDASPPLDIPPLCVVLPYPVCRLVEREPTKFRPT